jgi:hypothetical protein
VSVELGLKPDFGKTADDYGRHRAGFPDSLYERLNRSAIDVAGQRVVLHRVFAVVGVSPARA